MQSPLFSSTPNMVLFVLWGFQCSSMPAAHSFLASSKPSWHHLSGSSIWFAKPVTVKSVTSPSLSSPGRLSFFFPLPVSYLGGAARRAPPCRFHLALADIPGVGSMVYLVLPPLPRFPSLTLAKTQSLNICSQPPVSPGAPQSLQVCFSFRVHGAPQREKALLCSGLPSSRGEGIQLLQLC